MPLAAPTVWDVSGLSASLGTAPVRIATAIARRRENEEVPPPHAASGARAARRRAKKASRNRLFELRRAAHRLIAD